MRIYKNSNSDDPLPHTLTELYTQLCLTVLNRYLKTKTECRTVRKIENLPPELYLQFLKLAKFAFEGFKNEKVIFHEDIAEDFGFLDAVPELYGGCAVTFNFLHLTLQEFFAAYYISKQSDKGAKLFNTYHSHQWMVVWRFVAGLTKFEFLHSLPNYMHFLTGDHSFTIDFVQCLFEAQSLIIDFKSTLCSNIMLYSDPPFSSSDLDYYVLGYCIANCTTSVSVWEISLHALGNLDMFCCGLLTNNCSVGVIEKFYLFDPRDFVHHLLCSIDSVSVSPLSRITDLAIHGARKCDFAELISRLPLLQKLDLYGCDLHDHNTQHSLKLLRQLAHSKVKTLDLSLTRVEENFGESPLAHLYSTTIQDMIRPSSSLENLTVGFHRPGQFPGNMEMIRLISAPSSLKVLVCGSLHTPGFNFKLETTTKSLLLHTFNSINNVTDLSIDSPHMRSELPALVPDLIRILAHNRTLEIFRLGTISQCLPPTETEELVTCVRDIVVAIQGNSILRNFEIKLRPRTLSSSWKDVSRSLSALDQRIKTVIANNW